LTASTRTRPEKLGHTVSPNRSNPFTNEGLAKRREGGKNKAPDQTVGTNPADLRLDLNCEREKGRPAPNGVVSLRAHNPARFEARTTIRPSGFVTRQSSFKVWPKIC